VSWKFGTMKLAATFFFILLSTILRAQEVKFSVEVSSDTLLVGNYFELKYTIENASGNVFEPPAFHAFNLVGGPNTSSSMSIINGEVNQSSSYTYFLHPPDIGVYIIAPAFVTVGESVLEVPPIDIIVVPNPEGIIQEPHRASKRFNQLYPSTSRQDSVAKRPRKKF